MIFFAIYAMLCLAVLCFGLIERAMTKKTAMVKKGRMATVTRKTLYSRSSV